ncbi:hypothetical protein ABEF83_08180 [Acinetobacter thermotolerans]|uniref:hypothetical protein n=1 Tax=Acinetobacter thermotolerans TaxID=3151487 RepID=UPI00325AA0CF
MKRFWDYGTSTPIQRVGVIILGFGLVSLFSWMLKERLSFDDLLDSYYWPRSRDSFFFHLFFYFIPIGLLMSWGYYILVKIKEWVLKGKSKNTTPHKLHFKNSHAAFEFATKQYSANMNSGKMSLGIVQDTFKLKDGTKQFLIQLADVGKTTLVSGLNDRYVNQINQGDLVYWGFVDRVDDPNYAQISAIGHVLALLDPEYIPSDGKWTIKKDLTK